MGITIIQIGGLYMLYMVGSFIQQLLHIPIPGSMIGMLILFLLLMTGIVKEEWISQGANMLLSHLTLLFIPATVGIIDYVELFSGKGIWSIFVVIVSTMIVMLFAGFIGQWAQTREQKRVREVKGA
ncbi:CidA/LrgA family protein [Anoxybacillus flavithermus]|uniref:CidA/LrgA family protein n=1 Tax=Anoxybacillus flavithermus TaxID=33934 RepID=A0A2G5RRM2_9BACL|nr:MULTISPECIES: CidA/LrgA family holin-like protein [Anoxybacillus]KFZ42645.1 murein hydrolase transporter LrgA [Anoxybacillus sp. KU2-6(11)]PIC05353.1 CidA/LrgA family protein [Anoxybacillus flavithermus]